MNLKVKKFELNKETITRLNPEEASEVNGGVVRQGSVLSITPDSGCPTVCNHYYCIC